MRLPRKRNVSSKWLFLQLGILVSECTKVSLSTPPSPQARVDFKRIVSIGCANVFRDGMRRRKRLMFSVTKKKFAEKGRRMVADVEGIPLTFHPSSSSRLSLF